MTATDQTELVGTVTNAQRQPMLSGLFTPLKTESDDVTLGVTGNLPAGLSGMYIRNGPNPMFEPRGGYHMFDGDAMLHRVIFGEGRETLLKAIMEHHSLNAAIKDSGIDMSYRAAWGRLKASQERLGIKLIEANDNKRSGACLTEEAKKMLIFFEKTEKKIAKIIAEATVELEGIFCNKKQEKTKGGKQC
ncbi:MAG: carotenoid oxygenase family protein [Deltaproteobacteria bacterium]